MDKALRFLCIWSGCYLMGCNSVNQADLIGTWKASVVLEQGDTVPADLSATLLTLSEGSTFQYQMTPVSQMDGSYYLQSDILQLLDQATGDTIKVHVINYQDSAMTLRMNHEGTERHIVFDKVTTSPTAPLQN